MNRLLLLFSLLLWALPVIAGRGYSKQQLALMLAKGVYPERQEFVVREIKSLDFAACRVKVRKVMEGAAADGSVEEAVDTSLLYVVRIWATNGVITLMCTRHNQEIVILNAAYR